VHLQRNLRVSVRGIHSRVHKPNKRKPDIMGDKSPKSVNKKAAQKQSKTNTSNQKKQQATAARQSVPAKKK
jgi:hypothetical protein